MFRLRRALTIEASGEGWRERSRRREEGIVVVENLNCNLHAREGGISQRRVSGTPFRPDAWLRRAPRANARACMRFMVSAKAVPARYDEWSNGEVVQSRWHGADGVGRAGQPDQEMKPYGAPPSSDICSVAGWVRHQSTNAARDEGQRRPCTGPSRWWVFEGFRKRDGLDAALWYPCHLSSRVGWFSCTGTEQATTAHPFRSFHLSTTVGDGRPFSCAVDEAVASRACCPANLLSGTNTPYLLSYQFPLPRMASIDFQSLAQIEPRGPLQELLPYCECVESRMLGK